MASNGFRIFEELVLTVDKIGYEKTLEIIRNSRNLAKDRDLVLQEFIIQTICSSFSFSKKQLLKGSSSTNKTNALAICSYELKSNLGYSQNKIAFVLSKHDSVISKYIKRINYLNEKYSDDKILINKIAEIRMKIIDFKNNVINK
tara:strand:+ start:5767 stop:6201 length:435 start_codon:yes stop_codon:yes gene_type:complete